MTADLILHSTPKSEFRTLIREVLQTELAQLTPPKEDFSNKLYTRQEVADLLSISLPTLWSWTKQGTITAQRIGSVVRYKHSDVHNALQEIDTLKYSRK